DTVRLTGCVPPADTLESSSSLPSVWRDSMEIESSPAFTTKNRFRVGSKISPCWLPSPAPDPLPPVARNWPADEELPPAARGNARMSWPAGSLVMTYTAFGATGVTHDPATH